MKTRMCSFSGKSEAFATPGRGSHMATICQGWVLVAKWAGHLLSTPPADPCPSCLGWAAECVAETKVLCRRCPLGTQPRVRWGAGEGPHRRQPLSSLAAPRNGSQQGLNTHLVKGRRKREGELGLSRSTHSELINPLQEAAWCRSQEKLGLTNYGSTTYSCAVWGVYFTFWASSYPSIKWG